MSVEKRNPIPVKEAINRVVQQDIYLNTAEVKLEDSLGYVLAEDIVATYDIPRFNKSPMTGLLFEVKILLVHTQKIVNNLK